MDYSDFKPFVDQHFEASKPGDEPQKLTLTRIDLLPPPPKEYPEVRQQPFEMIFRSFTTTVLPDELLTLTTPQGSSYLLTLQSEHVYSDTENQQEGIQYRCIIT